MLVLFARWTQFLTTGENVDLVSKNDEPLFSTTLEECKRKGLLHRSVAIFLKNSRNEILLQQRSFSDDWLPGKWTVSSTGHVKAGELPSSASVRELKEELGIDAAPKFLFKFMLPEIRSSGVTEYEVAYAFEVKSDAEFVLDPKEVAQVRFFSLDDIRKLLQDRAKELTPDAIILLENYLGL